MLLHYCWFGGNKPPNVFQCLNSWMRQEPNVEIKEWNELNSECDDSEYYSRAIAAGQWAFAADYVRIRKLYEFGGIYLDTDMEMKSPIIKILSENPMTLVFEKNCVQACVIGCMARHPLLSKLIAKYDSEIDVGIPNVEPESIVTRITDMLIDEYGLRSPFGEQILKDGVRILSASRFLVDLGDGRNLSIHHYDASWKEDFDERRFVGDVKRYCNWETAPYTFKMREGIKVFLQYRLPWLYRKIRSGAWL